MSDVKIVLKRGPGDPGNGVWIDGFRVPLVTGVLVTGVAGEMPRVQITMIPTSVVVETDVDPETIPDVK